MQSLVTAALLLSAVSIITVSASPSLASPASTVQSRTAPVTLAVTRDPLTALFDPNDGLLLPAIRSLLQPRYDVLPDEAEANAAATLAGALLGHRSNANSWSRSPKHQARTKRLLKSVVKGLSASPLLRGVQVFRDQRWGLYTVQASNTENDNEWLVNVGFGTPSQYLKVVFDTGSPDTWIYSPACCYLGDHDYFSPSKSTSYANRTINANGQVVRAASGTPGEAWKISYGGGSTTTGYIGLDTFAFGGGSLQVDTLPVALATSITGTSRATRAMEGLVGLSNGAASPAAGGWTTPLEALVAGNKLDLPYLTASLVKANRRTGAGGGGTYILGGLDTIHQSGAVVWSDVTSSIYWGTSYDDMRIGSQSIVSSGQPLKMILDTGSALISLPPAAAKKANALIRGTVFSEALGYWLVPCGTGLPEYEATLSTGNQPFALEVNQQSFSVPTEDFVFYPNFPVPAKNANGNGNMCISAFQQGPEQFAIIGATFIKNHAVTFDIGNGQRRVGIANRTDTVASPW